MALVVLGMNRVVLGLGGSAGVGLYSKGEEDLKMFRLEVGMEVYCDGIG
jgi:hypothetical protein